MMKWKLLSFYGEFFPAHSQGKLAGDALSALENMAKQLQRYEWVGFEKEMGEKLETGMLSRFRMFLGVGKRGEGMGRARQCLLSTARTLCTHYLRSGSESESESEEQIHAPILAETLRTAISAYALLIQLEKRNVSARNMAEMKHWPQRGRQILEDLSFVAVCEEYKSEEDVPEYVKGVLPVLPSIVKAIGRVKQRYFRELQYEYAKCKCGCASGHEVELRIDGKPKQSVRYRLAEEVERDLGGDAEMIGQIRGAGAR